MLDENGVLPSQLRADVLPFLYCSSMQLAEEMLRLFITEMRSPSKVLIVTHLFLELGVLTFSSKWLIT